jgi:hypothetical protein
MDFRTWAAKRIRGGAHMPVWLRAAAREGIRWAGGVLFGSGAKNDEGDPRI